MSRSKLLLTNEYKLKLLYTSLYIYTLLLLTALDSLIGDDPMSVSNVVNFVKLIRFGFKCMINLKRKLTAIMLKICQVFGSCNFLLIIMFYINNRQTVVINKLHFLDVTEDPQEPLTPGKAKVKMLPAVM